MSIHAFVSSASYFGREIQGQFVVASKEPKDSECKRDFYLRVLHPDTGKEFGMHVFAKDVIFKDENAKTVEVGFGRVISKDGQSATPTQSQPEAPVVVELSDEELDQIIYKRFEIMGLLSDSLISGDIRSLIVSGISGIGKTYTLETKLKAAEESGDIESVKHVKGHVTPLQLYTMLFENKDEGQVVLLDDVDPFKDELCLSILKAALDTGEKREVSWYSTSKWMDENEIPQSFEYNGTLIFITNVDMDKQINRGSSSAPHLRAFVGRANYLDLMVHSNREALIRIKQIVRDSTILTGNGISQAQGVEMIEWLSENSNKLREMSLRTILKMISYIKTSPTEWKTVCEVMLLKKRV